MFCFTNTTKRLDKPHGNSLFSSHCFPSLFFLDLDPLLLIDLLANLSTHPVLILNLVDGTDHVPILRIASKDVSQYVVVIIIIVLLITIMSIESSKSFPVILTEDIVPIIRNNEAIILIVVLQVLTAVFNL